MVHPYSFRCTGKALRVIEESGNGTGLDWPYSTGAGEGSGYDYYTDDPVEGLSSSQVIAI
jgi:hypothetical protein